MTVTAYMTKHQDAAPLAQGIIVMECLQRDSDLQGHPGVRFSADSGRGIPTTISLDALQSPMSLTVHRAGVQDAMTFDVAPGPDMMAAINERFGPSSRNSDPLKPSLKTKI